ncbi:MAG: FUSC family protein [Propionibacteriaceae bacterium]|jgi:hypothetical protein|nr:FUSC family protein [Propionibacteriaceae bacterium]
MADSTGGAGAALATAARACAATMVVALPTFWSMLQIGAWWRPPLNAIVFAVMLGLSLPRALVRPTWRQLPRAVALFALACAAAVGCSMLLALDDCWRAVAALLFSLGVAVPVWLRRFGIAWRNAGTVASLPFMAVLVQPLPADPTWGFLGWTLLAAAVALAWALLVRALTPTEPERPPVRPPQAGLEPSTSVRGPTPAVGDRAGGGTSKSRAPAARRGGLARMPASARMAVQLGLATILAFAAAQALDPDHLVWPVLTVLVVTSANRGRRDVLAKGAQRLAGALAGTGIAAVVCNFFKPGDAAALVALFAVMALAAALRPFGYAFWAAGMTACLVFLYGYFGQSGLDLLGHRLIGILAGGALAIAAAWFVLPVRQRRDASGGPQR